MLDGLVAPASAFLAPSHGLGQAAVAPLLEMLVGQKSDRVGAQRFLFPEESAEASLLGDPRCFPRPLQRHLFDVPIDEVPESFSLSRSAVNMDAADHVRLGHCRPRLSFDLSPECGGLWRKALLPNLDVPLSGSLLPDSRHSVYAPRENLLCQNCANKSRINASG